MSDVTTDSIYEIYDTKTALWPTLSTSTPNNGVVTAAVNHASPFILPALIYASGSSGNQRSVINPTETLEQQIITSSVTAMKNAIIQYNFPKSLIY